MLLTGCVEKKQGSNGLKSILESKTGVLFTVRDKSDSSELLYYKQSAADLAKGVGRFDSAKSACVTYFNGPGTMEEIDGKAFFKWQKDGIYAVLVAGLDKDSSVVFNVRTSSHPILTGSHH
jgi:hypothetical protein